MRVDLSAGDQNYVQDCELCCNPLQIAVVIRNYRIESFDARDIEQ